MSHLASVLASVCIEIGGNAPLYSMMDPSLRPVSTERAVQVNIALFIFMQAIYYCFRVVLFSTVLVFLKTTVSLISISWKQVLASYKYDTSLKFLLWFVSSQGARLKLHDYLIPLKLRLQYFYARITKVLHSVC